MAYGDFKDLARRTASDKVLRDKAFNIAKNPNYDGYQRGLASMVYKFFDKKSKGSGITTMLANKSAVNNELESSKQLAKELHKLIIRNFKKRTVYSGFKNNIWGADLADMQLISTFNKGFRFSLCVIDIFSKYTWVRVRKVWVLLMHFKKILKNLTENQIKYGLIKEVNFRIILLKIG